MKEELFARALFPREALTWAPEGVWRQDDESNHFGWVAPTTQGRIVFVNQEDDPAGIQYDEAKNVTLHEMDHDTHAELRFSNGVRLEGNAVMLGELLKQAQQ